MLCKIISARVVFLLFSAVFLIPFCDAATILGVFPVASISHQVVYRALIIELAKRGHSIVVITPNPIRGEGKVYENIFEIDIHEFSYKVWKNNRTYVELCKENNEPKYHYSYFKRLMLEKTDGQLSQPQVQAFIKEKNRKFDLVIVESYSSLAFPFCHHFQAPCIGISSTLSSLANFEAMGNPTHPLLYQSAVGYIVEDPNLWEKFQVLHTYLIIKYYDYLFSGEFYRVAQKHFGNNIPSLEDLEGRMDLLFVNSHRLWSGLRPVVPGTIFLGSIHMEINKPEKLPQLSTIFNSDKFKTKDLSLISISSNDLKEFLESSHQGVIYCSLGSNIRSIDLLPATLSTFVKTFQELHYRVIWKWENRTLPDGLHTSDIYFAKWLPQQAILSHKNVRAFITQGGQQSVDEAIHYEVPVVAVPFLADQHNTARRVRQLGIGIHLQLDTMEKEILKSSLLDLMKNNSYKQNIVKLSALIRDEPQTPLERAVWWTEYVLRNRGAAHLRAPAADLPWYHYFMLDVVGTLLGAVFACSTLVTLIVRRICCTKSSKKIKRS